MSEWTVRKRADLLVPGDRFIFAEELGGEGEVLTVESAGKAFGDVEIQTEEIDFCIDLSDTTMVTLAPVRVGEGYCIKCGEPTDEFGADRLCAYHRDHPQEDA